MLVKIIAAILLCGLIYGFWHRHPGDHLMTVGLTVAMIGCVVVILGIGAKKRG